MTAKDTQNPKETVGALAATLTRRTLGHFGLFAVDASRLGAFAPD